MDNPKNILILGAAGRDFHNFNVVFRKQPRFRVVGFTATQIPGIASRRYPSALAGPGYPEGIPIFPEDKLEELIGQLKVDAVIFSYSDISHLNLMHLASRAVAAGADFWFLGTEHTQIKSVVPVVSVCAVRTGCGKSPVARLVTSELIRNGLKPVVIRHPMPYGQLEAEAVQRFATMDDLDAQQCTIEEREEYEPHLREGTVVYAGVDYERILRQAEKEADVILWDGGNNDTPFYVSDLEIVVADPHRAGHELGYHPGEANFRQADVIVISKTDSATPEGIRTVEANAALANPKAELLRSGLKITADRPEQIRGKRVLVVEDGPTVTHGGMPYGAATLLARAHGGILVDAKKSAAGTIAKVYKDYPHLDRVLPAMGYSPEQVHDLETTIRGSDAELVLDGSPVDLQRLVKVPIPILRVQYDYDDQGGRVAKLLDKFLEQHRKS